MLKYLRKILCITVIALMLITPVLAVSKTEQNADANDLTLASDRVIYIKDAPRDENNKIIGELEGNGSGTDPKNPLKPVPHKGFEADAYFPKYYLQTAFYQATELLAESGGTIVVMGRVYFGEYECYGSDMSARDTYTADFGNSVIKITSVYGGIDYRETADAKLVIAQPANITVLGSTVWENIDIETEGTDRVISFGEYLTRVGDGVRCYPSKAEWAGVAEHYVSLSAGHRYESSNGENPTLLVRSGTYNKISAGMWGTSTEAKMENAVTSLTLDGKTRVLGKICGTVQNKALFSGHVNITINSGTYLCDINGVGKTGMLNSNGIVNIRVNGGKFKNGCSFNDASVGTQNNLPAYAVLDFSGWQGDMIELAYAYSMVSVFNDVILPAGVGRDQLVMLLQSNPMTEETEYYETAKITTAEPDITTVLETEPETEAEETEGTIASQGGAMGSFSIAMGVAVLDILVIMAVLFVRKKRKKQSE